MDEIDAEVLITLVEVRPVLWDKTIDFYKDRIATKNAWREVCLALKPDFDVMEDKDKNAFGKEVLRRWTNLRDSFVKSMTKIKDFKKSCSAAKKFKKYVYSDQLQFLKKNYDSRETEDSLQSESATEVEKDTETQGSTENIGSQSFDTPSTKLPSKSVRETRTRKQRKPDEIEIKMLRALEADKPCSKTSFLLSLKPHLDKFDEQDYLQFQLGVLRVIESINGRKKNILAQPRQFTQYTPSMPHNQFHAYSPSPMGNLAPIYHPPAAPNPGFSQTQQSFNNPNGSFVQHSQPLQSCSSYPTGNAMPSPHPLPVTSSNERPPSTTHFYQHFGESLSSEGDNAVSPDTNSLQSIADSIDFSS